MNGADSLCDTLLAHDIDVCFANPGTSEMHFVAALDQKPQMRCVLGLFEGVVTGAADGYARMADKPAATLLHLGPGLANGLANLHNARRAKTPMINVVGDHAVHHLPHDAPLTSDIESLARPMSNHVRRIRSAADVSPATVESIEAAQAGEGGISTLILPADSAWNPAPGILHKAAPPVRTPVSETALDRVAQALRNGKRTVLLVGGKGLRADALEHASRIAEHTGAQLLAPGANARIERGQGRVKIGRIPFNVDLALQKLAGTEQLILVGADAPVAFFAYPGKPSSFVPEGCEVLSLTRPTDDLVQALAALSQAVGAQAATPAIAQAADKIEPPAASSAFNADTVMRGIAALMPDNAIICDESVTSGRMTFDLMAGSVPHDYLQITGGAIGCGIPLATGAAVACPDRKVVLMQADGSGMYTLQALWTQAREQLDVVTIIFANRSYAILHNELKQVGAGEAGHNARRMLDLNEPAFDWVYMAKASGVEALRVSDTAGFVDALRTAVRHKGPFLIEAVI